MKIFWNIKKVENFQWKTIHILWFSIENFQLFFMFQKKYFFFYFFWSISEKIFFGVEKKSWVQFRCKKLRPFDLWCFQRVLSTLTPPSKRKHYLFAFTFPFKGKMKRPLPNRSSHLIRNAEVVIDLCHSIIAPVVQIGSGESPPHPQSQPKSTKIGLL